MMIPGARRSLLVALGIVVSALVAPGAAADVPDALASAAVPAMCGHDAGQLTDGAEASAGDDSADVTLSSAVQGVLQKGRRAGYAAVLSCVYPDGHSGPNQIVYYDAQASVIGSLDLGTLPGGDQPTVQAVSIAARVVSIQVIGINADDEAPDAGTRTALITEAWSRDAGQVDLVREQEFTEYPQAKRLAGSLAKHDATGVRTYLGPAQARAALKATRGNKVTFRGCVGPLADSWFWVANDGRPLPQRGCLWDVITPGKHGYEFTLVIGYSHQTWRTWAPVYVTTLA